MNDLEKAKQLLNSGSYTCVLCRGDRVYTSSLRGVKPLVEFYRSNTDFNGFSAADKVVGRATAFLYILLGVKAVFARVISRSALEVFAENGVAAVYDTLTPNIINRRGDGICPFEQAVLCTKNPNEAFEIICNKIIELNI